MYVYTRIKVEDKVSLLVLAVGVVRDTSACVVVVVLVVVMVVVVEVRVVSSSCSS